MTLEKRKFGNTGMEVTPLGFGGAPFAILDTEFERVSNLLNELLDAGVNLLDTAAGYPGSEETIGKAVSHRRDEFILVSKCGQQQSGCDAPAWSAKTVAFTVDQALLRLKTDHLDVMLLHTCGRDVLEKGEALGALLEAKKAGKIRFAGFSGDNETGAYAAGLEGVDVIQTSINIADQRNIDVILPETRKHGQGVMAKRPIANAAWKDLSEQPGFYKTYASEYSQRLAQMNLDPAEYGITDWAELALRFTLSQEGVHVAIIGTTNPEHVKANLDAARKGPLPEEVTATVRDAFAAADPGGIWKGQG